MFLYFRYPHPKTNQFCYRHVLWANQEPRKFAESWECCDLYLPQYILPRRTYHLILLIREISDPGLNTECIVADRNIIHNRPTDHEPTFWFPLGGAYFIRTLTYHAT